MLGQLLPYAGCPVEAEVHPLEPDHLFYTSVLLLQGPAMASSNLLLFSFLQPRAWAWLVQGSNHGQDNPPSFIYTVLRISKEKDLLLPVKHCLGLCRRLSSPTSHYGGCQEPRVYGQPCEVFRSGNLSSCLSGVQVPGQAPQGSSGASHMSEVTLGASPMSSHITELDQVKQRPPSPVKVGSEGWRSKGQWSLPSHLQTSAGIVWCHRAVMAWTSPQEAPS